MILVPNFIFQTYVLSENDIKYFNTIKWQTNIGNDNFRLQSAWYLKEDPWEDAGKATTTEELERKVGKEEAFGASEVTFLLPSIHSGRDRAKKFYKVTFSEKSSLIISSNLLQRPSMNYVVSTLAICDPLLPIFVFFI